MEAAHQREEVARVSEEEEEHKSGVYRLMLIVLDTLHNVWIMKMIGFTPDR